MLDDDGLRRAARALYDESEGNAGASDRANRVCNDPSRAQVLARAERRRRWRHAGDIVMRGGAVLAAAAFVMARPLMHPVQDAWMTPGLSTDGSALVADAAGFDGSETPPDSEPEPTEVERDPRAEIQVEHGIAPSLVGLAGAGTTATPAGERDTVHAHASHLEAHTLHLAASEPMPPMHRMALTPIGAAAFAHTYRDPMPAAPVAWDSSTRIELPAYARALTAHDRDTRGARMLAPVADPRVAALSPLPPSVRAGEHSNPTVTLVAWR